MNDSVDMSESREGSGDRIRSGVFFRVNDDCICCGLCGEIAPHVFREVESEMRFEVYEQPVEEQVIAETREALDKCPVEAIEEFSAR